ncbi:MAG: BatB protein, partial [Akkermansiaceae bacterium]|nr:BatB protein [Akkermansiaceae bacterium]
SDLSSAVDLAIKTLKETGQRNNALVILSDGESHHGGLEDAAEDADNAGL